MMDETRLELIDEDDEVRAPPTEATGRSAGASRRLLWRTRCLAGYTISIRDYPICLDKTDLTKPKDLLVALSPRVCRNPRVLPHRTTVGLPDHPRPGGWRGQCISR